MSITQVLIIFYKNLAGSSFVTSYSIVSLIFFFVMACFNKNAPVVNLYLDLFHQRGLSAVGWIMWGCGAGEEEIVEKVLLFSNLVQGKMEQKKKFVGLWACGLCGESQEPNRERLKKIGLMECCTTGRDVEITCIKPSSIAKAMPTGQVNCNFKLTKITNLNYMWL